MSSFRTLILSAALLLSTSANAATWQLDPSHTRVGFRVSHMMVSSVEGSFTGVTGELDYEPGKVKDLGASVTVDMNTVQTGNEDRDNHLRTSDFLDVENHPNMTFTTTSVKAKKDGFAMTGDLTIRGVTKKVTFDATGLDAVVIDPWGNQRLGAHATTTIDRTDFGVEWNQALEAGGVLVGNDLTLTIDVEFIQPAPAANN